MAESNDHRPRRFGSIDYSATANGELEPVRQSSRGISRGGVEITPAGAPRSSRALVNLPTRTIVNKATDAPHTGRASQAVSGVAAMAAGSSNPKVALAGRAVGGAVAVNNLAAQYGVDLPGASKKIAAALSEKLKTRPRSEHNLFRKIGQAFSNKGEIAMPIESENAAGYASRLVGVELDERVSAQMDEQQTDGMAEFVSTADKVNDLIIEGEVVSVDSESQRPLTEAETLAGGGGSGSGFNVSRLRNGRPESKELALLDLEKNFDELDEKHELTRSNQRALEAGLGQNETTHPSTLEFEPVINPDDYSIETNALDVMSRLREERGDEPISLEDLRKTMRVLQRDAAEQLQKDEQNSNPFSGENLKEAASESLKKTRGNHDAYAGMMVMGCLAPLRQGIDAESVAAVAATASVMWCLSPAFRDTVGEFTDKLGKAADKKVDTAVGRERSGSFFKNDAQRERVEKRVKEKLNVYHAEKSRITGADENHIPRTTDSAAQQLVMLNDNAYDAMREKGADSVQVMRKYAAMKDGFNKECEADGLDVNKVNARARWLVGNTLQQDQTAKVKFAEIAHGNYVMSDPKKVSLGAGESTHRWAGSWVSSVDRTQSISPEAGFFSPRVPQNLSGHERSVATMMSADIKSTLHKFNGATTAAAVDELKDKLIGYSAGWGNQTYSMAGQYSGPAKAAGSIHSAIQAMKDDGIEPNDIRRVIDVNVSNTIDSLAKNHPREMSQFEKKYPQDVWVAEAVDFQSAPKEYLKKAGTVTATPVPHQSIPVNDHDVLQHEQEYREKNAGPALKDLVQDKHAAAHNSTKHGDKQNVEEKHESEGLASRKSDESATERRDKSYWSNRDSADAGNADATHGGKQRDYADEHRQQQAVKEKEAAVLATERERQAEASSGHRGRTATPAQERAAASYNNDYGTRSEHKADLKFDDSSTPEQEDLYNRGRRNQAQRNRRVRSNQEFIRAEDQRRQQEREAAANAQTQQQGASFGKNLQSPQKDKELDGPDF